METSSIEIPQGSNRNFGVVFAAVFAIIFGYIWYKSGTVLWWGFAISAAFLLVAVVRPGWLRVPNYLWFRFGLLLGRIIAPIVMAIVYITTVVPIGLIFKIRGKDILRLRMEDTADSYWIDRESQPQSMKNQF
jgi:hypothetical protein